MEESFFFKSNASVLKVHESVWFLKGGGGGGGESCFQLKVLLGSFLTVHH